MIFFRVTQNINIKTTDGTLVNYFKFKVPLNPDNETVYMSTYDDYVDLKEVFSKVDELKYMAKTLNESHIRALSNFPIELGVSNINEMDKREELGNVDFFEFKKVDIFKQLKNLGKNEISIALIGGLGKGIGEIIASSTALRILYFKLKEIYETVKIDIYINASNNSFYSRDKQIYQNQDFITNIFPLSINLKKLSEYDYFFDNSVTLNNTYKDLNIVDSWLIKFGIDYTKIKDSEKYNSINLKNYPLSTSLSQKINEARLRGKLLLFHPYSANINKSIPQQVASDLLKELLLKLDNYIIVSTLQIDSKIKEDNFIDLSKESKTINDFIYIISCMDKIITTDTSTYHISDAFMIPTITFFADESYEKKIKYYKYLKPIFVKDESKNFSKFVYENESLTFYKLKSWKKIKAIKIIKLLDSF